MKRPRHYTTKKSRKRRNKSGRSTCDICREVQPLETHHINGRKIPDAEKSWNLADLCPNCHTKVHLGQIIIERWLRTTSGLELFWHQKDEENFSGEQAKPYIIPNSNPPTH